MTPEGKVKAFVKDQITRRRAFGDVIWTHWPVQTGYGAPTLDCIGCHLGRTFAIETKAPGQKLTDRQKLTVEEMTRAGVTVFVIGERELDVLSLRYSGMEAFLIWLARS